MSELDMVEIHEGENCRERRGRYEDEDDEIRQRKGQVS